MTTNLLNDIVLQAYQDFLQIIVKCNEKRDGCEPLLVVKISLIGEELSTSPTQDQVMATLNDIIVHSVKAATVQRFVDNSMFLKFTE